MATPDRGASAGHLLLFAQRSLLFREHILSPAPVFPAPLQMMTIVPRVSSEQIAPASGFAGQYSALLTFRFCLYSDARTGMLAETETLAGAEMLAVAVLSTETGFPAATSRLPEQEIRATS